MLRDLLDCPAANDQNNMPAFDRRQGNCASRAAECKKRRTVPSTDMNGAEHRYQVAVVVQEQVPG